MKTQNISLLVASEQSQYFNLFQDTLKKQDAFIVGQANDVFGALNLARQLRPDIVMIDVNLPYTRSIDTVHLSRTGGIDAAMALREELSNTRVLVLNNLDDEILEKYHTDKTVTCSFLRGDGEGDRYLALEELFRDTEDLRNLIFTGIELQSENIEAEVTLHSFSKTEKTMLTGGLLVFAGWFLTLTVMGAAIGVPLAIAGFATMAAGIIIRKVSSRKNRVNK